MELKRFENNNIEIIPYAPSNQLNSIEHKKKERDDAIVTVLEKTKISKAIESFLVMLKPRTSTSYRTSYRYMVKHKILDPNMNLADFAVINYQNILSALKTEFTGAVSSRMARAGFFISFTRWLSLRTSGVIPICVPIKLGVEQTFFKVRDKAVAKPLSRDQCKIFLDTLKLLHYPTFVVAKVSLNSGRRILEVLSLRWRNISFEKKEITFTILKSKTEKRVNIAYRDDVFADLDLLRRVNVNTTLDEYVFTRTNGSKISYPAVWARFRRASSKLNMIVRPHNLRATYISIALSENHSHNSIAEITGHASTSMVEYYNGNIPGQLSHNFSVV